MKVYRIELELTGWDMVSVVMGAVDNQKGIKIINNIREVETASANRARRSARTGLRKSAPGGGPTQQDKFEDYLKTLTHGTVITLDDARKWFTNNGLLAASASSVISRIARDGKFIQSTNARGAYQVV